MSIVSGTIGAVLGSAAQRDAARKNLQAARESNELNYRMFQEGRGSGGHAFLPMFFGGREKSLAKDAMGFYDASKRLLGSPDEQLTKYNAAIDRFKPLIDASTGTLEDVYNGNLTNTRQGYLQPVKEARVDAAKTQQQSVLDGLKERINALNASSAKKGYSGTGSFAQNRLLNATIGARQGAAGTLAAANLANAEDTRDIYDNGASLKLQLMQMPMQRAQQALNLQMLPLAQVQENFSRSMQPFEFFRMAPSSFRADPLPMQGADSTWPAVMAGIGNANIGLANMFSNQNAVNNARAYQAGSYGATMPTNWGSLNAGQQGNYMSMLADAQQYQGMFE